MRVPDLVVEVDAEEVSEGVPSGSQQLSAFLRCTRQNKIRKVVREVYLRDDVVPEPFDGADQILVLDTNVALHQIDFIAEDPSVNHVVVPYTVLQEVRHRQVGTYHRLRSLCRVEQMDEEADKSGSAADAGPSAREMLRGRVRKDMSTARNARKFYVFPNEFFRETHVSRKQGESQNDRNDRAIRRVAHWYQRYVAGPEVILLTDDRACKARAAQDGLTALTAREFVEKMRSLFPEAGEKLALREDALDDEELPGAAPEPGRGEKRKASTAAPRSGPKDAVYPPHLKASQVELGLKEKRILQGVLRMHAHTCLHGTVVSGDEEVEISGRMAINRAVDGDVVAIQKVNSSSEGQLERAGKRICLEAGKAGGPAPGAGLVGASLSGQVAASKPQGQVVGIIKRNWREYCGTLKPLHAEAGTAGGSKADRFFIPADPRLPDVMIQTRNSESLEGKRIVVVIDSWDRFSSSPRGHWTQILGDVGDRNVESAVILHEHGVITREFGEAVLRCLPPADFTPGPADIVGRWDLRDVCVCSVDPPGCKDIDDAVSCEPLPNGNFRVGVHIADVTHFVHPDTAVDREAAERCTTVYLVERRTDMLPGLLTTDICSLRGGVDRLTFSVLWEMTPSAEIVSTEYGKAIIKSRGALSYAQAQVMIDDPKENSEVTASLRNLLKLTRIIRAKRMERGALELASQEVRFQLDSETQDPTDVAEYQLRETNKLIEELMLLANNSVASKILDTFPMFGVLRRHPPPKEDALKALKKLLAKNGFNDFRFGSNKELGQSLTRAVKPNDPFFNKLVRMMTTRCMNQAVYFCTGDVQPALYGHYGLAMARYTHFTSPIRRYADILVHRLLMAAIGVAPLPEQLQSKVAIVEQCDRINVRHRMAQWASQASAGLHTFMYFSKRGSQCEEAVVTRVRRSGMQVMIQRYGIDGSVPMPDTEWDVDEDEQRVTNRSDPSVKIVVFDHVVIRIEADGSEFRNKTRLQFERLCGAAERIDPEEAMDFQKRVAADMFPDRLEHEVN